MIADEIDAGIADGSLKPISSFLAWLYERVPDNSRLYTAAVHYHGTYTIPSKYDSRDAKRAELTALESA